LIIGSADAPISTLTTSGSQQQLVAANMINLRGTSDRQLSGLPVDEPLRTISAGGGHAALVAAFMTKFYSQGTGADLSEPTHTLTTNDRMGVVTVDIDGTTYAITDISMRMLTAREQFRAQGFPDSYEIDTRPDGTRFTSEEKTRMCGNSVPPHIAAALVRANCAHLIEKRKDR
jgi:DNA (cytosine-5)-methyltransferase 1